MAAKDLRSVLKSSGLSFSDDAMQRVQVELTMADASEQTLEKLRAHGLQIESSIANKISGTILGKDRKTLESLDEVAGIEDVVQLKPHSDVPRR